MVKYIFTLFVVAITGLFCNQAYSQVNISGPTCVMPGTTYQYSISGNLDSSSTMHVCINGGIIADTSIKGSCSGDGPPLSAVLVVWSNGNQGSLTVTSSKGNASINVNVTSSLATGLIDPASAQQNFYDTLSIPAVIHCSEGSGGSCAPSYSYQWQRSQDAMTWEDIPGVSGKDLSFSQPAVHTFYYRRKITENHSNTIGYSSMAVVNVIVPQFNSEQ